MPGQSYASTLDPKKTQTRFHYLENRRQIHFEDGNGQHVKCMAFANLKDFEVLEPYTLRSGDSQDLFSA